MNINYQSRQLFNLSWLLHTVKGFDILYIRANLFSYFRDEDDVLVLACIYFPYFSHYYQRIQGRKCNSMLCLLSDEFNDRKKILNQGI